MKKREMFTIKQTQEEAIYFCTKWNEMHPYAKVYKSFYTPSTIAGKKVFVCWYYES